VTILFCLCRRPASDGRQCWAQTDGQGPTDHQSNPEKKRERDETKAAAAAELLTEFFSLLAMCSGCVCVVKEPSPAQLLYTHDSLSLINRPDSSQEAPPLFFFFLSS
jgi:hypothetical protein